MQRQRCNVLVSMTIVCFGVDVGVKLIFHRTLIDLNLTKLFMALPTLCYN